MPALPSPIRYADGQEALPRDVVSVGKDTYTVEHVIDTPAEIADWGTRQRGLMFLDAAYELLFQPESSRDWASVVLVRRGDPLPETLQPD